MDFNYLYHRHQTELMRAGAATSDASRLAHQELADAYAGRIDRARASRGAGGPSALTPAL